VTALPSGMRTNNALVAAPFALLALACGSSVDGEASRLVAEDICDGLTALGSACSMTPGKAELSVASHKVEVHATVQDMMKVPGKAVATVRMNVVVDGQAEPGLSTVAIKDAGTAENATRAAALEWSETHRDALAGAFASHWGGDGKALLIGSRKAHRGALQQKGGNVEADGAALLQYLEGHVEALPAAGFHTIELVMSVEGGKPNAGSQCFVDGKLDGDLCVAAAGYSWPEGSYIARQVYVFSPS